MSGTISSQTNSLLSAAQQAAAAVQPVTASSSSASSSSASSAAGTASSASSSALSSLAGNFTDFLNLLMTQLQNQDPTSPMDTDSFTTELVQFTGVQEQVNTNSSLTQLIQLTQDNELMQTTQMVGDKVQATSNQIPLQNGSGALQFTASTAEPVAIAIDNSAGQNVKDIVTTAQQGSNSWTWDGTDNNGNQLPDGAYSVAVLGQNADGSTTALPFTVTGTATGVTNSGGSLLMQMGAVNVNVSNVQSIANSSTGS